jgi:molybdopterin converting factor small subunit
MVSTSSSLLHKLEQPQQLIMMKKLLFAVCRNYWENDQTTLLSTEIEELITELRQVYPSLKEVNDHLDKIVNRLNKREKYYPVAKKLMGIISQFYGERIPENSLDNSSLEHQIISLKVPVNESSILEKISETLEEDQNSKRIHKMLFAVTRQRWENHPETLASCSLKQLVQEVYETYPTLERLSLKLLKIVNNISKKQIYSQVYETIITQFSKAYNAAIESEKLKGLATSHPDSVTPDSAQPQVITETIEHKFNYNPYRLRQQVMKQTNPLRVKMLLYYSLNPTPIAAQQEVDGLLLKTYELDKMLMQIIQKFQSIKELQYHLETAALAISSIQNRELSIDQNLQVAKALVRVLQPLYTAS